MARLPGIHPRHWPVLSLSRLRAEERPRSLTHRRGKRCGSARGRATAGAMGFARNRRVMVPTLRLSLIVLACCLALAVGARAETIKVGLLKTVGSGPIFIA